MARKKVLDQEKLKSYFATKEELDEIRSNATLLKWEVLSRAYKLGKELWGREFNYHTLSRDMGVPYTTVKRCMGLDKATDKSWELLKAKKISAFKLAMICSLKSNGFQDEIVAEVIDKNLSTYNIKHFKPKNIKDVTKWKHEQAAEKGYARKSTAYISFSRWIDRGFVFMIMPFSALSKEKQKEILVNLKKLHKKIGAYIKKHEVSK